MITCRRCGRTHQDRNIDGKFMAHGHYSTRARDIAISIGIALLPFVLTACMLKRS